MQKEVRYPLFVFFCSFYIGYIIATVTGTLAVAVLVLATGGFLAFFFRRDPVFLFLAIASLPVGLVVGYLNTHLDLSFGEEYEYVGIAVSDATSGFVMAGKGYFLIDGEWVKTGAHVGITYRRLPTLSTPKKGDVIWTAGRISKNISYPFYTLRSNSFGSAVEKNALYRLGNRMKAWVVELFDRVGLKDSSLLPVFLGEKAFVDRELVSAYREVGISHLFAVSGFHVGLMYLLLGIVFRGFMLPLKMRLVMMIVFLGLYALTTGPSVSSLRAYLVFFFYCLFAFIDYPQHELNMLGLAALSIALIDPPMLSSVAFQLSFGATAAILIASPLIKSVTKFSFIIEPLLVSVVAQMAVLPVLLVNFERFSLLTIPLTLIAVPVFILPFFVGSIAIIILELINAKTLSMFLGEGLKTLSGLFEDMVRFLTRIGPEISVSRSLALLCSLCLVCSGLVFFFGIAGKHRKT